MGRYAPELAFAQKERLVLKLHECWSTELLARNFLLNVITKPKS
jgi:hypothetical protein